MRIDAYSQVQQLYKNTQKVTKAPKQKASFMDAIQISSTGKDIQTAKTAVAQSADVRSDMVEPIKASILNGTYDVSADDFADKLLERYQAYNALIG